MPFSTRGTNRGQALPMITASCLMVRIALPYAPERIVAAVPITPILPLLVAAQAA